MRAKDFLIIEAQQELFEVNMSPGNLKKLVQNIPAKVGIEFEMIVPDVGTVDDDYDDYEMERDDDADERADDISDIVRFFNDGEYNTRSEAERLRERLQSRYQEWISEQLEPIWQENATEKTYEYVKNNVSDDEIADELDIEPDLFDKRPITADDYKKFAILQVEDEGSYYDDAKQEFFMEVLDDPDSYNLSESEWLDAVGLEWMSDVERRFDISWPHYIQVGGDGDAEYNLSQVADEFSRAVGMPANYSTSYHGGYRSEGEYDIEPDSSLHGDGDDAGLEFISPPLSVDDAIEQIKRVKEWADERGAYTNRSTGLHMNVSVPEFNPEALDFVKLTILLGDKYLLDRFGRSANTYCKSAMDVIQEAPSVEDKELLFKKLKNNLDTIASKVIHSGRVGKFTSINPKDNRVEFRGPGGDWLGGNFEKIEDTLYRCVVALDAAVDPEKYRKDYLKKLTKLFTPSKGSIEDLFVQYAAGTITRQELKNKLKSTQSQRKQQKYTAQGIVEVPIYQASNGDWIVEYDNPTGDNRRIILKRTEQINDDKKALEAAIKIEPSWFKLDDIENILVTQYTGNHMYAVHGDDSARSVNINAFSPMQAIEIAIEMYPTLADQGDLVARLEDQVEAEPEETPIEQYKLYKVITSGTQQFNYVAARSVGEARRIAMLIYPSMGTELDVVLQDATRTMISSYQASQQETLNALNQSSSPTDWRDRLQSTLQSQPRAWNFQTNVGDPQPAFSNPNEDMESYIVSGPDGSGQVVFRATSPENAIERARAAYNLSPDQELVARLEQ